MCLGAFGWNVLGCVWGVLGGAGVCLEECLGVCLGALGGVFGGVFGACLEACLLHFPAAAAASVHLGGGSLPQLGSHTWCSGALPQGVAAPWSVVPFSRV